MTLSKHYLLKMLFLILLVPTVLARDPTQAPAELRAPVLTPNAVNTNLRVTSILFGRTRRMALVNGKWLQEGDTIIGARVEKIDKNKVWLKRAKKMIQLQLVPDLLRKQ